jgi:hypothetical protein
MHSEKYGFLKCIIDRDHKPVLFVKIRVPVFDFVLWEGAYLT